MSNKTKGIIFIILSAFSFALMNVFVKLAGDLPSFQKSFFRNLVALIFAAIILIRTEEKFQFNKKNLPVLFIRSLMGTIGIVCNYYAIDHLLLADASMLNKLSPFFVIIFSFIFLKEKVNLFQICAIVIAFIGTLFIIKPGFISLSEGISFGIGLLGGVCAGAAYSAVRALGKRGERGPFIVFFFSTFSCVSMVPYLIFYYEPMSLLQLFYLLMAGLGAAGGQFAITAAYSYAPSSEISVFDYTSIIFSALFGFFLFGQIPDVFSFIGYFIILSISIAMFFYNRKYTT